MTKENIRALRELMDLSRVWLGHFLGVTEMTVVRWEAGSSTPKGLHLDVLVAMAALVKQSTRPDMSYKTWGEWMQAKLASGRSVFLFELFARAYDLKVSQ